MKILNLFLFCIINIAFAQISINVNHFPIAGDSIYYTNFTPDSNILLQMGPGANWDLNNTDVLSQDYQKVVAINQTPIPYQFSFNNPLNSDYYSDYSVKDEDFDLAGFINFSSVYNYYRKENNAIIQTGMGMTITFQGTSIPLSIPFDVLDTLYDLDLSLGTQGTDSMAFLSSIPSLGAYGRNIRRNYTVDAEGVMNINGQDYNCIRIRNEIKGSDTIYIDQTFAFGQRINRPTEVQYLWLSTDYRLPILEINGNIVNNQEVLSSARVLDTNLRLSISALPDIDIHIYPNPSTNYFQIDLSGNTPPLGYSIHQSNGQVLLEDELNENNKRINCENWASGIYYLNIFTRDQRQNIQSYQIIKE